MRYEIHVSNLTETRAEQVVVLATLRLPTIDSLQLELIPSLEAQDQGWQCNVLSGEVPYGWPTFRVACVRDFLQGSAASDLKLELLAPRETGQLDSQFSVVSLQQDADLANSRIQETTTVAHRLGFDSPPGVDISPITPLSTSEQGGTSAFTVVLTKEPAATVTFDVFSEDDSEGFVSPNTISFTSNDWDLPQAITVQGLDDAVVDGDTVFRVTLTPLVSSDRRYDGLDPTDIFVVNTDNDIAGIQVSSPSGHITTEAGGEATFSITLRTEPVADVHMAAGSSDPTEGAVQPETLIFTPKTWNTPQLIRVTGLPDDLNDGDQAYSVFLGPVLSPDPSYDGLDPEDVSVVNIDRGLDAPPSLTWSLSDEPDPVEPGSTLVLRIGYGNLGIGAAENCRITLDYDQMTVFVSANIPPGVGENQWNLGRLNPGDSGELVLTLKVSDAAVSGSAVTTKATLSSDNHADVVRTEATAVQVQPDLMLKQVDAPDPVVAGGLLTYTVFYSNAGKAQATNVQLIGSYDPNITFVSADPSPDSGTSQWNLNNLQAGDGGVVTLTTRVNEGVPDGTMIVNRVDLITEQSSAATDEATGVDNHPAVTLVATDSPDPVGSGDVLRYRLAYANIGDTEVTNILINATYDPNTAFLSAIPEPDAGVTNRWSLGKLAPGARGEVFVTLTVGSNLAAGTLLESRAVIIVADQGSASTKSVTLVGRAAAPSILDVDANGTTDGLTDGLLVLRRLFGFSGTTLTDGALGPDAKVTAPAAIAAHIDANRNALDVDASGATDALTDGILIVRHLRGISGEALTRGALAPNAIRTDPAAIAAYVESLR